MLTPTALTLREWSFAFDATKGNGGLTLLLRPRPSLASAWRLINCPSTTTPAPATVLRKWARLWSARAGAGNQALTTLRGFDANLDLRLGALVSGTRTWRDLRLLLGVKDGQLDLKTLRVDDVAGADLRVTGGIDLNQPVPLLSLAFAGGGARMDRLASYLGEGWRRPLRQLGATRVSGRVSGAAAAADLEAEVAAMGGRAKLSAPVDLIAGLLRGPAVMEIEHPEVATLVGLWDSESALAKRSIGPGLLRGRLTPRRDERQDLDLDLRAGEMAMIVSGTAGRLRQPWPLDLAFDIRHPARAKRFAG